MFSRELIVEDVRRGQELTHLVHRWSCRSGRFELAGETYEIDQTSFFAARFELTSRHRVLASAKRIALFSHDLEVQAGERTWQLVKPFFSRDYEIRRFGATVGSIARTNWFARDGELVAEEDIPPELAIFFLWLAHTMRRRSHAH
jgi:hypothetical protein